jgi:uncharacterized protein YprB with RNaseH-like and TPR domain
MLERTFQIIPNVGPAREKELWRRGVQTWKDFPQNSVGLSRKLDESMRSAIERAQAALEARDVEQLVMMLPSRERWRLYPHFANECAYLDIETDGTGPYCEVTAIGVLWKEQVYSFVPGYNLEDFERFAENIKVLVTFNGSCFDVPVLERYFRHLRLPKAHIDLRFTARTVGLEGGLKRIENELGLHRPLHLRGLDGYEAVRLWRVWRDAHDVTALRMLVEYNLYDAIQLKPLLERVYNRTRERALSGAASVSETERGELLYDVTRVVSAFGG